MSLYDPAHPTPEAIDAAVLAGKEARKAARVARAEVGPSIPFEAPGRFGKCPCCGSIRLKVDRSVALYCEDCGNEIQRYD